MSAPAKRAKTKKRTTTPRRRDARENYERIVRVAAQVFAERGLGATLADVAREAGVGVGTVYRCFANKDDLILALFAERLAEVEQRAHAASRAEDPWDGFVRYFDAATQEMSTDRGLREFIMGRYTESLGWARGSTPHRIISLMQRTDAALREHATRLVRRAKRAGALRKDLHPTDMLVLTVAVQGAVEFAGAQHPELRRRIIGIVLDGLRASRSAPTPLPVPALTDAQLAAMMPHGRGK